MRKRINHEAKNAEDKLGWSNPKTFMLDKLKQSGLTQKDATILGYQPYTVTESVALNLQRPGAGFILPYFDLNGRALPMFRYRYQETEVTSGLTKGAKMRKYDQPTGTDPEIYFPRLIDWKPILANPEKPIIITEGELKAACATKYGHPTIGVGGVYSFGRKSRHQVLLPALQAIKWKGREVYVCYDSDAVTNSKVLIAENRLARALTDVGAVVSIVRLPSDGEAKVGLDDFIVQKGVPAFEELLQQTDQWAECEELHRINAEAVYIAGAQSMVVVYPREDAPKQEYVVHTLNTFIKEICSNRLTTVINAKTGLPVIKNAAEEWSKWPNQARLSGVCYEPGKERVYKKQLNMWQGWGAEPVPGDITPWTKLLDHIFKNNPEHRHWFTQWCAYPMQHPGFKLKTACVFWSVQEGTGKSILGYTLGRIYGDNFSEVTGASIKRSFNGWAVNKQFIMGEEITGGAGRDMADQLKNMITGTDVEVNVKYKPTYFLRNSMNYYFTSNHPDAFFINDKDRRYFIQEVPPPLPPAFWEVYDKWYKSEAGPAALFHYLLNYDLTGFNPQAAAPKTKSRNEMVESNRSEMGAWVHELREHPDNVLRVGSSVMNYTLMTTQDLMAFYAPENMDRKNKSERAMAIALKEAGFRQINNAEAIDVGHGVRKRAWAVRDAKDAELGLAAGTERYQTERKIKGTQPKHAGKGK